MAMKVHSSRASDPRPANPIQLGLIEALTPQMFHAVQDSLTFTDSNLASGPIGHPKPTPPSSMQNALVVSSLPGTSSSRTARDSVIAVDTVLLGVTLLRPIRQPLFLTRFATSPCGQDLVSWRKVISKTKGPTRAAFDRFVRD